jgi:RimJ/RimL family protein N-acetyltransferase
MIREMPVSLETADELVVPTLRLEPVTHQLQLGLLEQVRTDPTRYPGGVRMLALRDSSTGALGLALQTPPYPVVLSAMSEALGFALGREFCARYPDTRSARGAEPETLSFARGAGGTSPWISTREAVFELRAVRDLPAVSGRARLADPSDAALLQRWSDAFAADALPADLPNDPHAGARLAGRGRTWLWLLEDGTPASYAHNGRRVCGWWSVGPVYTPRALRGQGYATGLVAHVSRWALASGASGCTLFTDLSNPVSNRIYERIGYERVAVGVIARW